MDGGKEVDDFGHLRGALTALAVGGFLLHLKALNDRSELAEDIVGLLVVLNLGGDELGQVAQRLRSVEHLRFC